MASTGMWMSPTFIEAISLYTIPSIIGPITPLVIIKNITCIPVDAFLSCWIRSISLTSFPTETSTSPIGAPLSRASMIIIIERYITCDLLLRSAKAFSASTVERPFFISATVLLNSSVNAPNFAVVSSSSASEKEMPALNELAR